MPARVWNSRGTRGVQGVVLPPWLPSPSAEAGPGICLSDDHPGDLCLYKYITVLFPTCAIQLFYFVVYVHFFFTPFFFSSNGCWR